MNIAIIGASGFIGSEVTRQLLDTTEHTLVLFSHRASLLQFSPADELRIKHVNGSVLELTEITDGLQGCDSAVYLVHLMGSGSKKFITDEQTAARNFAAAVTRNNVRRVVYVGGMGDDTDNLTNHLASRSQTGKILRETIPEVIELKTPMVIGTGGAGFEMLKKLVHHSPILPLPTWVNGLTYPITVGDVARYVIASLTMPLEQAHYTAAIGGPDKLSYRQVAVRYAAWRKKRLFVMPLPFVPQGWVIACLRLLKKHPHAITVADMLGSASYTPSDTPAKASEDYPITPEAIENAFT